MGLEKDRYFIFSRKSQQEEGMIEQYGILYRNEDGAVVKEIPDIGIEFLQVKQLEELLNQEEVELCHFEDVVEDFLI